MSGYMQKRTSGRRAGSIHAQRRLIDLETALGGLRVIFKSDVSLTKPEQKNGLRPAL